MSDATDISTKLDLYQMAVSILDGLGHESEIDEEYSGRCMYGKTVPAIITDAPGPMVGWAICMALAERQEIDTEWPADSIGNLANKLIPKRTDNMGLRTYVYY